MTGRGGPHSVPVPPDFADLLPWRMALVERPGMWPWFLQRVTGALLLVWLAIHMAALHWGGHESQFFYAVARRLRHGGWVLFDLLLIVLCLYHGLNGVRAVLLDVLPGARARRALKRLLWVVGLAALVIACKVLAGFLQWGEVTG